MKLAAIVFAILLSMPALAFADVIMPNTHSIEKCVKISGLDVYPGYAFIGVVSPISSPGAPLEFVQIANNKCIVTGTHYKFDGFSVYYANKSYIDKFGISGIKASNISSNGRQGVVDENLILLGGDHASAPYAPYYVDDSDNAKSVTIEYIVGNKCGDGLLCIQKVKEEKSNQPLNETGGDLPPAPPDEPHTPTPQNPAPTQLGPLQAFWCWLMGMFGGKC